MSEPRRIVVPTTDHSVLGPSGSKRWISCPGSVLASKDAKDDEDIYAASGSATHYLSELARNENKQCVDWLGDTFVSGKYEFVVDEAMADSAQDFVDWCEETPGEVLVECRIHYSDYFAASTLEKFGPAFGTLDDARLADDMVVITDFKDGQGVQEFAEGNSQLLLQALGVYEAFSYMYDIKRFKIRICQPRLGHHDEWEVSTEYVLEWAKNIEGYGKAVEAGTKFQAGSWCRFCRIRKTCAVRANQAVAIMLQEGEFEDLDQLEVHAMRAQNRLQFITNDQLAKILPALDVFRAWIADVERRAMTALIGRESIGGWKLVAGRSSRKVIDEKVWAEKLRSLEVDPYERKVLSVAKAEKALGKKEFAQRFKLHEDFVKPPGKPKLAPPDDRRPAVDTTAINDFESLDADDE